jgi:hypothetical protein
VQTSDFEQPQFAPQRAVIPQSEPAETPHGTPPVTGQHALEVVSETTTALVTAAAARFDRTAASCIDRVIRASTAVAVLAVAALAAYISYWHAYAVVRAHGESGITARLEPATIDGLVYASSMIILYAARHRIPVPPLARWLLGLGIAATLATNMAQGWPQGPIGMAVAAWPAVSLIGSYELLVWLIRTAGTLERTSPAQDASRRALVSSLLTSPTVSEQHCQNPCEEPHQTQRPKKRPGDRATVTASKRADEVTTEIETINSQAVASYRLSVQAGNPLSERKLARMFGRTSRRWARARITEGRGILRPEGDGEMPHGSTSEIPTAALLLS